ncbi:hypothetical protein [Xanthomonas maliensis]|uniref:hypothetical protein n=1 Tax=Xanthomonas maliensis TaxID=1321368 RepID=UPI00039A1E2C
MLVALFGGLRPGDAPPVSQRRSAAAVPLTPAALAARQAVQSSPPSLFDAAIQQLRCRERQLQDAAQIARAAGSAGQVGGVACQAGTPLQIEALLRTAAAHGDADAQRYLLAQQARELMQRTVAATPAGMTATLSPDDEQAIAAVVRDLEALALRGNRDAIETLAQVVESPLLHAPDPVYAAAWRLAARQPADRPAEPGASLQGEDELLDALNEPQRQQARALAVEVFEACCQRPSANAATGPNVVQSK